MRPSGAADTDHFCFVGLQFWETRSAHVLTMLESCTEPSRWYRDLETTTCLREKPKTDP